MCSGKTHQDMLFWPNVYCCVTQQLPTRCQLHLCWLGQVRKWLAKEYIIFAHGRGHQASFILILPCFHYWWTASLSTPLGHLNDENPARQCANCTKSIQWSKKSKTHSIAQCNWMCFWFFASLNAFSDVLHSTQMDNRNFPWHLGFENKFYARITNSGEMCVGFRLFPATVFL